MRADNRQLRHVNWARSVLAAMMIVGIDSEARTLVVLAEESPCVQLGASATAIPFTIDATKIRGSVIGPVPGDFTRWEATAGKWNRVGTFCDPEGDQVAVEIVSAPPGFAVTADAAAGTWTLAGELPIGISYIQVRAIDSPQFADPTERSVTVIVKGTPRPNKAPVLQ